MKPTKNKHFRGIPAIDYFQRWPQQSPIKKWIFPFPLIWTGHMICFDWPTEWGGSDLLGLKWPCNSYFLRSSFQPCKEVRLFFYRRRPRRERSWRMRGREKKTRLCREDARLRPRASTKAPDVAVVSSWIFQPQLSDPNGKQKSCPHWTFPEFLTHVIISECLLQATISGDGLLCDNR